MKSEYSRTLRPDEKFSLTIEEAAEYFCIGTKKLRQLSTSHIDDGIFTRIGSKIIVHREAFGKFIVSTPTI